MTSQDKTTDDKQKFSLKAIASPRNISRAMQIFYLELFRLRRCSFGTVVNEYMESDSSCVCSA